MGLDNGSCEYDTYARGYEWSCGLSQCFGLVLDSGLSKQAPRRIDGRRKALLR
jgi:hypothetical protein